ncbi:hypothetical protein CDAR_176881 [Caerostris darwini]|uniref:Uncharacterized protein n=1 Tax=Caerostris darwini TaxID=1538125 RepID=A0AAV4RGU5_9ARAC|nr:hypothetical protein CDAR_176881 [Caerostris darwini]
MRNAMPFLCPFTMPSKKLIAEVNCAKIPQHLVETKNSFGKLNVDEQEEQDSDTTPIVKKMPPIMSTCTLFALNEKVGLPEKRNWRKNLISQISVGLQFYSDLARRPDGVLVTSYIEFPYGSVLFCFLNIHRPSEVALAKNVFLDLGPDKMLKIFIVS